MTGLPSLESAIRKKKRIAVLLSGGLDSSVLAMLAYKNLKADALAVNIDSPVTPSHEKSAVRRIAEEIGIRLVTVKINELDDAVFSSNPAERCYICRKIRHRAVKKALSEKGFELMADGVNSDDLSDYRPGLRAADEDGIWHPFAEYGIAKSHLRDIAKSCGLSVWNSEPSPCLCTRFAYGMQISREAMEEIDRIESFLKTICRGSVRLRCFPMGLAMVETDDFEAVLNNRAAVADMLHKSGFVFCSMDLEGFASGKMNRLLDAPGYQRSREVTDMARCAKPAAKAAKPAAKKAGCAKTSKCGAKKKA